MGRRELWEQVDGDLYEILGVPHDANASEITNAWKRTAKTAHPDSGGTVAHFQSAELAYRVLNDPLERRRYDQAMRPSPSNRVSGAQVPDAPRPPSTRSRPMAASGMPAAHRTEPADIGDYRDPGPSRPLLRREVIGLAAAAVLLLAGVTLFSSQFLAALPLIAAAGVIAWSLRRGRG